MPGALLAGVLIGVTEARGRAPVHPSAKSMFAFAILVWCCCSAARAARQEAGMMARLARRRSAAGRWILLAFLFASFVAAPLFVNDYVLTVLILILYFAYPGQAWNIMMGFAASSRWAMRFISGSAPTSRRVYREIWRQPVARHAVGIPVAAVAGPSSACSAFASASPASTSRCSHRLRRVRPYRLRPYRFRRRHRPGFSSRSSNTPTTTWTMRGDPPMFYYIILCATALVLSYARLLVGAGSAISGSRSARMRSGARRRHRYLSLQDVCGDGVRGATSFAGVFYAFYYNNAFSRAGLQHLRSIEMHPRPDHRRRRDVVRSDPRRIRADRPRRGAQLRDRCFRHRTAGSQAGVLRRVPPARRRLRAGGVWPPLARRLGVDAGKQ